MNRVMRGTVVFAAALGLLSCGGDPTSSLRNGIDHLVASPSAIFVDNATTRTVIVTAVDKQGNSLGASFDVGSIGAGITVVPDDSFNLVYDTNGKLVPPTNWTRARFVVGTGNYVSSSFVVTAGGKSITIPVRTNPATLTGPVSNLTPLNGDTVTLTLPTGLSFDTTALSVKFGTFAGVVVGGTTSTVSFVAPPGASGQATVGGVTLDYDPAVGTVTALSASNFHVAPIPALPVAPTSALVGDTITLTLPAPFKWTARSHISAPGASAIVITSVSTDSSTIKFRVGPNADTTVAVDSTVVSGVPTMGRYTLTSTVKLTSPSQPTFPVTFSTTSPAWGDTVTVTTTAGFKFLPTASFATGGVTPIILSRAADSSAITFIPYPTGGLSAPLTLSNVVFASATTLPLTLPSSQSFKAAAGKSAPDIATAPTIVIPATGLTTTYVDAGGFVASADCAALGSNCRFYKFTLTGTRTFQVTLTWGNTADIGGYFVDNTGTDLFGDYACDSNGSGAGGQPETCSQTLTAGTYWLGLANFSATAPSTVRIDVLGQ